MDAGELAKLRVAGAARAEWAEAHAPRAAEARRAEAELQRRGLTERIPVTDAEVAEAAAEPRQAPPMDPDAWASMKAEQTARVQADREAEAERMARLTPVTDAEIERYGTGAEAEAMDVGQDRAAVLQDIRAEVDSISAKVDEMPDPAAERRAEMDQAGIDEPVVHEPQAEPSLEASWQPGDSQGHYEAAPDQAAEPEMEIG